MPDPTEGQFGKLENTINKAKELARTMQFEDHVNGAIDDLNTILSLAMEALTDSFTEHLKKVEPKNEPGNLEFSDHFEEPTLESTIFSEEKSEEPDEISVDDLIGASYSFGKTDEEKADEFVTDLKATVSHYAWLFVAIGMTMEAENKQEIVKILEQKAFSLTRKASRLQGRKE